ncbi:MAG: DUF4139 domain-containing protein [Saprospiraceae bacterium]
MKQKILLILISCFSTFFIQAQQPIVFESEISEVTIYRSGARIIRDAKINIPAGQSEIVFSNLTTQINTHSLQAQVPEGVDLVMVHYKTNFLKEIAPPEKVKEINAEMETLGLELDWNNNQYAVFAQEEKILTPQPVKLSADGTGISVQDLKEYTSYYRDRSLEVKKKLFDIIQGNKKINARLSVLQKELKALQPKKNQKTGEVVFLVQSTIPRQCEISFSYISNQAGWAPVYDLKVKDTQSPIALDLKANVHQNTGIDWKAVKMSISTGNPLLGNDRPILRPKYINFAAVANRSIQIESLGSSSNMAYAMKKDNNTAAGSVNDEISVENTIKDMETTREYEIDIRQTVPSSGLKRIVQLKRYEVAANYKYHTVPKLDLGVFLLAEVANWGKYNLLPGTANIFFQNTYIGQSAIRTNVTADKILLSLGRDESIKVQRERTNYLKGTKFWGDKVVQNIGYTITVKNTKNKKVAIEILDQIPIAQHEDIKIVLKESTKAEFYEKTGGLKWELELAPNESRKLIFEYTQKSPAKKPLALR